ncbi:hypothetical protein C8R44DRAFT_767250 [Mycena epipterygia]|nr:hypothetical protein C8R44DRAFT_767250 [Mycena epipterygia]
MPPTPLAQEMLDCIVGRVQERRTLKACSLVARSFVFPSQQQLFRSVCSFTDQLYCRSPTRTNHLTTFMTFDNALPLFTMSPHLANHVRELYIILIFSQDCLRAAESVLRLCSRIVLLGICSNGGTLSWASIPASLV